MFSKSRHQNDDGGTTSRSTKRRLRLSPEDVKVFLVDPRQPRPCMRELALIYGEQANMQEAAVRRVDRIEAVSN